MRAPVSRSRPLRSLPAVRSSFGVTTPARGERWRSPRGEAYGRDRLATSSAAGSPGAPGTSSTRAGVSGRVAELVCGSVADQGLKRDVVACPRRRQCRVSVLRTADRRQPRRDKRLERHRVRLAPAALGELDGLAGAPALRAWESRTGPEAQAQIDSSAFEVDIAAEHAPRRLELQRELEELLHAPDRDASVNDRAWYPPGSGELRREPHWMCVHWSPPSTTTTLTRRLSRRSSRQSSRRRFAADPWALACSIPPSRERPTPETRRNGPDAVASLPCALHGGSCRALVVAEDPWPSIS